MIKYLSLTFLFFTSFLYSNTLKSPEECRDLIIEGIELMNSGDFFNSLKKLSHAKNSALSNFWWGEAYLATNNMGSNYYLLNDYIEATSYFTEAYEIAVRELDLRHELSVLNNISIIYLDTKEYDKALEYLNLAYAKSSNKEQSKKRIIYAMNLALVHLGLENYQESYAYIQEVLNWEDLSLENLLQIKIIEAKYYVKQKEYGKAQKCLEEIRNKISPTKFKTNYLNVMATMSEIHFRQNNLDLAYKFAHNFLSHAGPLEINKTEVYQILSEIHHKKNEFKTAYAYKDSIQSFLMKYHDNNAQSLLESNKIKFELMNYENELVKNKNQLKTIEKQKNAITIISIVLLFCFLILVYAMRQNHKLKKNSLLTELKTKETNYKKTKNKWEEEKEVLQRELLSKQLYLNHKKEWTADLVNSLEKVNIANVEVKIPQLIQGLKSQMKNENVLEEYFLHFEKTNPSLIKKLLDLHPELTQNDLRFLSYIYINLSLKEIATLLNISLDSAKKRNSRLKKKMNLSSEYSLYKYLIESQYVTGSK